MTSVVVADAVVVVSYFIIHSDDRLPLLPSPPPVVILCVCLEGEGGVWEDREVLLIPGHAQPTKAPPTAVRCLVIKADNLYKWGKKGGENCVRSRVCPNVCLSVCLSVRVPLSTYYGFQSFINPFCIHIL